MYKETETLELKRSLTQLKEGVISLSSMLNKNGHGELYFGISDDGKTVGIDTGKKTKNDITHEIQFNLKPLPTNIDIEDIKLDNKTIIKISVEGNDTPYSAYGRYYIRIQDADISMQPNDLQHFFEQKEDTYSKWEQKETSFGIEDINEELLIDCIRRANDKGRLDYVYRNPKEALEKFGLLTKNGKLNNAGYYLFGNNKPLTIKEANFPTDTRTEFGEIKEYSGNIFECIQESISYIQNRISYKSNIVGVQREEIPEIPLHAIREIVINAFAHCSYAKQGDFIEFILYKSFLRIYNPGPIIRNIDPTRFASGVVGSKIRNCFIANTLYKCGYIDAFGTGFDRTFTLCAQSNIDYEYRNDEFGFTFIFHRDEFFLAGKVKECSNQDRLDNLDKEILSLIKKNKYITIPELAEKCGKSEPTIHRHLDYLVKIKKIERIGSRKTGYWDIAIYEY